MLTQEGATAIEETTSNNVTVTTSSQPSLPPQSDAQLAATPSHAAGPPTLPISNPTSTLVEQANGPATIFTTESISIPATTSTPEQPSQVPPAPADSNQNKPELQAQQNLSPQKAVVTKVKLSDELNIFDWFRSTDIINQIAEKAKNSVDSVITVLDPGMKEYLYSGGNINIIVISDTERFVSPIRDAFQTVFGRATVVAARYNPPEKAIYPVKLACGFEEAITVAQERIKLLRNDTSTVPQNQVVVVIQPTLVSVLKNETYGGRANQGLNIDENLLPKWFLTYSMIIEDPVLGSTINSYSQFIPIDTEVITIAKEAKFPDGFSDGYLGFAKSINELMAEKLNMNPNDSTEDLESSWINKWSGLDEIKIVHDLSISSAHLYRRKWNSCIG